MENNQEQKPVKIEFKEHRDITGSYYYTTVNDISVTGSWDMDKDKAYQVFTKVVENGGGYPIIKTLETVQLNKSNK